MQLNFADVIGTIAAILTTSSLIPQLIKVVTTKSTKDISLGMFSMFTLGLVCWLTYGLMKGLFPVILANVTGLALSSAILGYKIKYK